jgi:hypothetical protein
VPDRFQIEIEAEIRLDAVRAAAEIRVYGDLSERFQPRQPSRLRNFERNIRVILPSVQPLFAEQIGASPTDIEVASFQFTSGRGETNAEEVEGIV